MPTVYLKPTGERKLEFWKTYRGGQKSEIVSVPSDWHEDDIQTELEDWCQFQFHNSDYMSYGWNDECDFGSRS